MNQHDVIQQAWALTEQIEAATAGCDWPRAAELAEARAPLLMSLQADQPADALATIRKIQSSIEAVTQAAGIAQEALVANHRRSMERASAASRYQQAARF
ncbi:hypothetical protein AWB81_02161 [Caballeronia arationis]|jgi:hypothetical protein|uniref:Flagellar protein FliT n=1 Tax=Caballeronia arationis TaxID=1777142 RepID=A0A7Z7N5B6_9BURK|nr:hypothetical protein [Caballeronia arationis]SAK61780.1 hypothetical protein AWB81_02161 [Caballeronia arationis]SOE82914.1 hypothetical protein SAMN05446927_6262 [Caballeronia arationis]